MLYKSYGQVSGVTILFISLNTQFQSYGEYGIILPITQDWKEESLVLKCVHVSPNSLVCGKPISLGTDVLKF